MNITKEEIQKFLKDSVEWLENQQEGCTTLKIDDRLAVCVGWLPGYGNEERDDVIQAKDNPDWAINAGIKVWTSDDMRTDYEFINSPYYDSGEVVETDVSLDPSDKENDFEGVARWLYDAYAGIGNLDIEEDGRINGEPAPETHDFDDDFEDSYEKIEEESLKEDASSSFGRYSTATVAGLKKFYNDALDVLENYDDDAKVTMHANTYRIDVPFIGTYGGYIEINNPVKEDDDYDESLHEDTNCANTLSYLFNFYSNSFAKVLCAKYPDIASKLIDIAKKEEPMSKFFINNKVKESCDKKPIKESWDGENIIDDLIDRAQSMYDDGGYGDIEDCVRQAIDDGLIYSDDILALAQHYGTMPDDSELVEGFYEELFTDVYNGIEEKDEDEYDDFEETDESLKEDRRKSHYDEIEFFPGDEGDLDAEDYIEENGLKDVAYEWDDYRKGYVLYKESLKEDRGQDDLGLPSEVTVSLNLNHLNLL